MNIKDVMYDENQYGMNYRIFYPDKYDDLPLIIYLHGAGERGTNISHLYRHGIPKLINEGKKFDAVILAIQCPKQFVWDNVVEKVKGIIDCVVREFNIKNDRISITGSSMGGFGTWMMGKTYPSFFAGIAPVAGGGMSWRTEKLRTTPVFAVHGSADEVVPCLYSQLMVDGVNENGGNAKLEILEGYDHNDGIDYAYRCTDVIKWLTEQRRKNFEYVPEVAEHLF